MSLGSVGQPIQQTKKKISGQISAPSNSHLSCPLRREQHCTPLVHLSAQLSRPSQNTLRQRCPELHVVQTIVVEVLLNHTYRSLKVEVDGVDLLVPFLQITEIADVMCPIWTRAGESHPKKHLRIGGWSLFCSKIDTEPKRPNCNVHDFRRILTKSGLTMEDQQKLTLEATHCTNCSSHSKESFEEANKLRSKPEEQGFLDSLRKKVHVRHRAEKASHPEWNNCQILPQTGSSDLHWQVPT